MARHQRSASAPCLGCRRQNSLRTLVGSESGQDTASTIANDSLSRSGSGRSQQSLKKKGKEAMFSIDLTCDTEQKAPEQPWFTVESQNTPNSPSQDTYCIFSVWKKRWIVTIVSVAAFFAPFSVNSYFPAMNMIEQDLGISSQQVNLSVTVFMVFQGVSPSFWSAIADRKGRRPVYLFTFLVFILSSIGLALTEDYTLLLVLRMIQAFGASPVIAIGAGVIADISHRSERGGYIGWYSLGWNLGPVIGPAIGGVVSQFLGWRWVFWVLVITASVHWALMGFCLPETLRLLVGNGSGIANPTPLQWWHHYRHRPSDDKEPASTNNKQSQPEPLTWKQWLLQPLLPLLLFKEKDVLILVMYYSVQYAACYVVTTSVPHLFADRYQLDEIRIGISYFPMGFGCILGSIVQGKVLNRDYQKMRQRFSIMSRASVVESQPIEHTRMRTVWIHAIAFNILLVVYGWILHVQAHLAIVLTVHFFMGFTSQAIFSSVQTLLVDLFPSRTASVTATNNIFRCLLGAAATVVVLPGIQVLGVGWMFTTVSVILLIFRFPIILELSRGPKWRHERYKRSLASCNV